QRERPDAIRPTLGGQTALNLALDLHRTGVLDAYGIKLIGAQVEAIEKAEDRQLFKQAMEKIGLSVPLSGYAHSLEEARQIQAEMAKATAAETGGSGYPVLLRPSFTLGGSGAAVVWNGGEFDAKVQWGLQQSPRGEVLVEQSVLGWKEYELEVMRDKRDNAGIIFAIEKFPGADDELGPQMKSVGEVMAIGRTFKESLGKALRSLEIGRWGLDLDKVPPLDDLKRQIVRPSPDRLWQLAEAMRAGLS